MALDLVDEMCEADLSLSTGTLNSICHACEGSCEYILVCFLSSVNFMAKAISIYLLFKVTWHIVMVVSLWTIVFVVQRVFCAAFFPHFIVREALLELKCVDE